MESIFKALSREYNAVKDKHIEHVRWRLNIKRRLSVSLIVLK